VNGRDDLKRTGVFKAYLVYRRQMFGKARGLPFVKFDSHVFSSDQ
jgi:hypothetical protein